MNDAMTIDDVREAPSQSRDRNDVLIWSQTGTPTRLCFLCGQLAPFRLLYPFNALAFHHVVLAQENKKARIKSQVDG